VARTALITKRVKEHDIWYTDERMDLNGDLDFNIGEDE
jgi:hypothetical protein